MATATLGRESQKKQLEAEIEADLREIARNRQDIQASRDEVAALARETKEILLKIDALIPDPMGRLLNAWKISESR